MAVSFIHSICPIQFQNYLLQCVLFTHKDRDSISGWYLQERLMMRTTYRGTETGMSIGVHFSCQSRSRTFSSLRRHIKVGDVKLTDEIEFDSF